MKKIWLAIALAMIGVLYASPIQAAEISVVALPNPIGIPEIIFISVLCGLAFWKTSWIRVILSICIIIWGVFTMSYDIKIAAPLIAVGTLLCVTGTVNLIGHYRREVTS